MGMQLDKDRGLHESDSTTSAGCIGGGGGQPCESHMSVTEKQTTKLTRGEGCHHRVGVHNDGHGARGV